MVRGIEILANRHPAGSLDRMRPRIIILSFSLGPVTHSAFVIITSPPWMAKVLVPVCLLRAELYEALCVWD